MPRKRLKPICYFEDLITFCGRHSFVSLVVDFSAIFRERGVCLYRNIWFLYKRKHPSAFSCWYPVHALKLQNWEAFSYSTNCSLCLRSYDILVGQARTFILRIYGWEWWGNTSSPKTSSTFMAKMRFELGSGWHTSCSLSHTLDKLKGFSVMCPNKQIGINKHPKSCLLGIVGDRQRYMGHKGPSTI